MSSGRLPQSLRSGWRTRGPHGTHTRSRVWPLNRPGQASQISSRGCGRDLAEDDVQVHAKGGWTRVEGGLY